MIATVDKSVAITAAVNNIFKVIADLDRIPVNNSYRYDNLFHPEKRNGKSLRLTEWAEYCNECENMVWNIYQGLCDDHIRVNSSTDEIELRLKKAHFLFHAKNQYDWDVGAT